MSLTELIIDRYYGEMWNRWRFELIPQLLSPALKFRGSLGVHVTGHSEFAQYMEQVRSAFPDFQNRVTRIEEAENSVTALLEYRGTHQGELFSVSPTGKTVVYEGLALFTFDQGLIREAIVMSDRLQILEQLLGEKFWRQNLSH